MHTILVIGGAGFIGRHCTAGLAAAGYAVYATVTPGKEPPTGSEVTWIPTDLTAANAADHWPARCDAIIYLAQSRRWRAFPDRADDVFAVNVAGLHLAATYARRAGVQLFLYASTGSIYPQTQRPAQESDPIDLAASRTFYVACKLAAEALLQPYEQIYPIVRLRLFMPYGIGQSSDMLLPQIVQRVRSGQSIQLHGTDGLLTNPVFVADVVEVIHKSLSLNHSAALNVAGPEVLSLRTMSQIIGRELGREPIYQIQSDTPAPIIAGSLETLQATLAWCPQTPFAAGVQSWLGRAWSGTVQKLCLRVGRLRVLEANVNGRRSRCVELLVC